MLVKFSVMEIKLKIFKDYKLGMMDMLLRKLMIQLLMGVMLPVINTNLRHVKQQPLQEMLIKLWYHVHMQLLVQVFTFGIHKLIKKYQQKRLLI
jgi:hypothetical protein